MIFQINKDLEGEVFFQAQTGTFSIPVKCSTKKCEVKKTQKLSTNYF